MFKKLVPVLIVFIFINAIIFISKPFLLLHGFDLLLLFTGNTFLFLISITGFIIQYKNVYAANTNIFLRGIYTSLLIKMFAVIIVVGAYLFKTGGKVNKPSMLASMAFYIVYTTIEVRQMITLYRPKKNA